MTKRTGNNQFLKQLNQSIILDLIRVNKAISKAQLAEITGLSPTAIGMITSSLQEQGYIHETGIGESKGGRKPVLLELKPRSYYSVGVDFDVDYMNILLVDITGEIISEKASRVSHWESVEKVMEKMESMIDDILSEFSIETGKLLGIGISVPGMVDWEQCEVVMAPNLGWEKVAVKDYMKRFQEIPIYLENEAMASAICENWVGSCQGINNFVCINIKSGIGAGIFTHGRLYRGASGSAGEVGHIVVDESGPKCGCGNYGCLETMASTSYIVEKARKLIRQGSVSSLNDVEDADGITIEDVIRAARSGDGTAINILNESARYLGIAISNIANTLNPSKVILGKEFVKYADLVMEQIVSVVACKALKSPAAHMDIASSMIGERASTLGAALIPVKTLFGK